MPRPRFDMTFASEESQRKLRRIAELLSHYSYTRTEIAERLHMSPETTLTYLKELRRLDVIRISWWYDKGDGRRVARYFLGSEPDAPRKKALGTAEKARLWRKKIRDTDPDRYISMLARKRAKRTLPRRDPMVAAFFGQGTP